MFWVTKKLNEMLWKKQTEINNELINGYEDVGKLENKIERLEKFVTLLVQLNRGNAEQSFHALQFNKDSAITKHVIKETLYNEKG